MSAMQKPIFFGHWRNMLDIAREQASAIFHREADRLSCHSASIILSRTCLEIYFNEIYFIQTHEGNLSDKQTFYSHKKGKRVRLSYKNFVDLHICERLEVSFPLATSDLINEVSLQNQIRNYCVHYTASDTKRQLELEFSAQSAFRELYSLGAGCPQEIYINRTTARWCNDVSLNTIIAVEEGQIKANANTELNIRHCQDLLNSRRS